MRSERSIRPPVVICVEFCRRVTGWDLARCLGGRCQSEDRRGLIFGTVWGEALLDALLIDGSLLGAPATDPVWVCVLFLKVLGINVLGYFVPAGLAFGVICVGLRRRLEPVRLQQNRATPQQMRREILWSMSTVLIFAIVGTTTVWIAARGWTQFYFASDALGWIYLIFSFFLLIVLHDTYFYWTHRAMHLSRVFEAVHLTHHRSVAPTPWCCYSFSPGEALVQALFYPLVVLAVPFHPTIVVLFALHQIVRNTLRSLRIRRGAPGDFAEPLVQLGDLSDPSRSAPQPGKRQFCPLFHLVGSIDGHGCRQSEWCAGPAHVGFRWGSLI